MTKAVITVIGKDTVGIIAGICTYLAEKKVNILSKKRKKRKLPYRMGIPVSVPRMNLLPPWKKYWQR